MPTEDCILNFFFHREFSCCHCMDSGSFDSGLWSWHHTTSLVMMTQETDTWSLILVQLFLANWCTVFFLFLCECSWDPSCAKFAILHCFQCTEATVHLYVQFPGHNPPIWADVQIQTLFILFVTAVHFHPEHGLSFKALLPLLKRNTHCISVWPPTSGSARIDVCQGDAICFSWKHQNPQLCFDWTWFEEVGHNIFCNGFLEMADLKSRYTIYFSRVFLEVLLLTCFIRWLVLSGKSVIAFRCS